MLPGPIQGIGPVISTAKPAWLNCAPASTMVVTLARLFVMSGSKVSDAHRAVASNTRATVGAFPETVKFKLAPAAKLATVGQTMVPFLTTPPLFAATLVRPAGSVSVTISLDAAVEPW